MAKWLLVIAVIGAAWMIVFGLRIWARRRMLDVPNERSSHTTPTPRGGGLAIVVLVAVAGLWVLRADPRPLPIVAYLAGGLLIATVSWIDDLRSLPNRARFACHLAGAALVIVAFVYTIPTLPGGLSWGLVGPLVMVWIVGLTNLYNFMDGIDGLAGGQALVSATWWAAVAFTGDMPSIALLALALGAASAGFLLHNWPPARIFMGDVGSAFVGYTFAVLPLFSLATRGSWTLALGGALTVWPFLFDGTLTILRRLLRGENIFRAHRSHLYQRLVLNGYSHATVSGLYLAYAVACSLCGWVIACGGHWGVVTIPIALGGALLLWVASVERRASRRSVAA